MLRHIHNIEFVAYGYNIANSIHVMINLSSMLYYVYRHQVGLTLLQKADIFKCILYSILSSWSYTYTTQ